MKKTICILLCALCCLALPACGGTSSPVSSGSSAAGAERGAVTFTDDLGREVTVSSPRRVASMIGSFSDIWCLAGGKDVLVAAAGDTWTRFDLGLGEDVADIGSLSSPSVETLLAAEPDLILASANTTADVELLDTFEAAGIPTVYFSVSAFSDYLRMLDICTQITGCRENYETYGTAVAEQVDAAKARADGSAPTALFVRSSGTSCRVKDSQDSVLGEMLLDLGAVNIADSEESLLTDLSFEVILEADPDFIFVVFQGTDEAAATAMLEQTLLSNPAWQSLTAVREDRFYILDEHLYNLKPNARWGEAYEQLAEILYPAA